MRAVRAESFAERVRVNQRNLRTDFHSHYDFIACGSGSSGSVVARRLAEHAHVSVQLLEAGGDDDVPNVTEAGDWLTNLGSERDWGVRPYRAHASIGRSVPMSMGEVLGGGSGIDAMIWGRRLKSDWDCLWMWAMLTGRSVRVPARGRDADGDG